MEAGKYLVHSVSKEVREQKQCLVHVRKEGLGSRGNVWYTGIRKYRGHKQFLVHVSKRGQKVEGMSVILYRNMEYGAGELLVLVNKE